MLLLLFNAPASIWTPSAKQVEVWTGESTAAEAWISKSVSNLTLVDGASFLLLTQTPSALALDNQISDEPQFKPS